MITVYFISMDKSNVHQLQYGKYCLDLFKMDHSRCCGRSFVPICVSILIAIRIQYEIFIQSSSYPCYATELDQ